MDFFTINILLDDNLLVYLAILVSVVTFVFLFLRKKNHHPVDNNKCSDNELEIKLRAYERLTLFLDRIEPTGMINRLQLHNVDNIDILKAILIKNIIAEYEYNISQQIYVSDALWQLIELVKNKIINSVSSISDDASKKSKVKDFLKKMLMESANNTSLIKKAQKMLKQEVRMIS